MMLRLLALCMLLAAAACSNPERVRISQSPPAPPPIPDRKPLLAANGSFVQDEQQSDNDVQVVPLGDISVSSLPEPAAGGVTQAALPRAAGASAATLRPGESYRVQRGDTVYAIGRRFGVSPRAIIEINDLSPPYALTPGQRLRLPAQRVHRVAPGETLHMLSQRYGVEQSQIAKVNGLQPPYRLSVGQSLSIPSAPSAAGGQVASQEAAVVKAAAPASARKLPPPAPAPSSPSSGQQAAPQPAPQPAALPTSPPKAEPVVPPTPDGLGFLWPTQGRVIAEFGPQGDGRHNDGINIAAPRGAPVVAAERGEVVFAGSELKGFGNLILIRHEDGWVSAYAHNASLLVSKGARVTRGQVIARVGRSGNVDRSQLHFEIRKGSRAVDPRELLPG